MIGVVVILSAWTGWWFVDPAHAIRFLHDQNPQVASAVLSAVFTAPVIGITIQGTHIFGLWLLDSLFKDYGRGIIATEMHKIFDDCVKSGASLLPEHWQALEGTTADSLFVWLYHRSAPNDLIEWARRRRSYYYLGVNLILAVVLGLAAGALLPALTAASPSLQRTTVALLLLAWCCGALWAARKMLRDVDQMELLWAAARVDGRLKECLERKFGTIVHERIAGTSSPAPTDANPAPDGLSAP